MSIKLDERYPGRANPASIDYPQGSFKNRTSPTAKDGTYLEQDWANDIQGFLQSLLKYRSVVANGQVDKAGASQYFDALFKDPSETLRGMPLVATDAEARAFANDAKVLTPAKLAAAFSGSNQQTGLNGFQKLPGGFVIQRVQVATPSTAGATQPFTWPLAFAQEPGIAMAPNYGAGGILGLSVVTRNATGGSVMCGAISGTPASIAQTTIIGFGVLP